MSETNWENEEEKIRSIFDFIPETEDPIQFIAAINKFISENQPKALLKKIATELPQGSKTPFSDIAGKKKIHERFDKVNKTFNQLMSEGPRLLNGTDLTTSVSEYKRYLNHVERIWLDAKTLFEIRSFNSAAFHSILCIEEIGKVNVCWWELLNFGNLSPPVPPHKPRQGKFYSHTDKHLLAAFNGALINARLDRVVGIEKVMEFLNMVESNRLEYFRQSCLYASVGKKGPDIPNEVITKEKSQLYLVLAGELMADVLGHFPWEFRRIMEYIELFEKSLGIKVE